MTTTYCAKIVQPSNSINHFNQTLSGVNSNITSPYKCNVTKAELYSFNVNSDVHKQDVFIEKRVAKNPAINKGYDSKMTKETDAKISLNICKAIKIRDDVINNDEASGVNFEEAVKTPPDSPRADLLIAQLQNEYDKQPVMKDGFEQNFKDSMCGKLCYLYLEKQAKLTQQRKKEAMLRRRFREIYKRKDEEDFLAETVLRKAVANLHDVITQKNVEYQKLELECENYKVQAVRISPCFSATDSVRDVRKSEVVEFKQSDQRHKGLEAHLSHNQSHTLSKYSKSQTFSNARSTTFSVGDPTPHASSNYRRNNGNTHDMWRGGITKPTLIPSSNGSDYGSCKGHNYESEKETIYEESPMFKHESRDFYIEYLKSEDRKLELLENLDKIRRCVVELRHELKVMSVEVLD